MLTLPNRAISRRLATMAGIATLLTVSTATARDAVQPGKPAPDFTAKDAAGKDVRLSSFKGRTVVLEWTNQDCPYVRKHYGSGNKQALQKDATGQNVVWLTVSSSAPGAQGHVNGLEAEKLTVDRKAAPSAFLLDPDGRVGRLYGATVTPHMYVIDKAGTLAFMGGIDDKPTSNQADIKTARNYVREALTSVAAGQPVKTASTRPYGCTIKYADPRN